MTILPQSALNERLDDLRPHRRLVVTPMLDRKKQVGPGSIDLRLGTDFLVPRRVGASGIDPAGSGAQMSIDHSQERIVTPLGDDLWLHPGQLVLGSTLEFIRLPPDCAAYVLGRSSWGRIGLLVATAVTVQPGYAGSLTLELVNEGNSPIKLVPGLRIAQLVVHKLSVMADVVYSERFNRAIGPEPAKLGWDQPEVERVTAVGDSLRGRPRSLSDAKGESDAAEDHPGD